MHDRLEADGVPDDDSFPSNKTNLAIKGIIAIEAMSAMSLAAGEEADASKYKVCHSPSNITATVARRLTRL